MADPLELETLTVRGTAAAMGEAQGEHLRERIHGFLDVRFAAVDGYCRERGRDGAHGLLDVGRVSMACFAEWDPEGFAEHRGIARGAGVDPLDLYTATNMTDLRDVLLLSDGPDAEGCSAVVVPPALTATGGPIAGQTWDLNASDVEFVVAIQRRPEAGLATWSVTCAGCLTLMGINERGLVVGTTNVKTLGARGDGVGYLGLLHRAIRCEDAETALRLVEEAPRVGAHTYFFVDPHRWIQIEASPGMVVQRRADEVAIVQTNHCLEADHQAIQGEPPSPSSETRLAFLEGALAAGEVTVDSLKGLFADRSHGIYSVNRYAEDDQGTATNSVFIGRPDLPAAWACRGSADRGRWVRLGFES